MPRPHFPHTLHDVVHAVDGPLGLVVGDLPDGRIFVLKRNRKEPGYVLTAYADAARSQMLATRVILDVLGTLIANDKLGHRAKVTSKP